MRLADLRPHNRRAIAAAGPRYAPGLDVSAPNLTIASLDRAFETAGVTAVFRADVTAVRTAFQKAWREAPRGVRERFARLANSPVRLLVQLSALASAAPQDVGAARRAAAGTTARIEAVGEQLAQQGLQALQSAPPDTDERRSRDAEYGEIRQFLFAVHAVRDFLRSTASELLEKNVLLLLGGWGMGKTHSLCDLTKRRMAQGLPTLFCLGQQLPDGVNPLDALCQTTGLARDGTALLTELDRMGRQRRTRSMLIVDAINEGDRRMWQRSLLSLCRSVRRLPNLTLILSCRQPFEQQIVGRRAAQQLVVVHHQGFGEIEFDAQLSFFQHYDIPAPQVPLMTAEYSRPLFLQLLCKAIADLSRQGKHRQLKSFASGQKGMTFLLEYFAKKVGVPIEQDFGLPGSTCWRVLKGHSVVRGGPLVGIAPLMAEQLRDYITWDECLTAIEPFVQGPHRRQTARQLARRMVVDGLLTEELRWEADGQREVVRFPYQRFADHIIARSLLQHLDTTSPTTIRRSFYRHRPLGRVFDLAPGGRSYQRPGFASAVMLEFPERVTGHVPADETELVFYLPRNRQLVAPFKEAFLEGLPWRSAEHFTAQTHRLIAGLIDRYDGDTRNETLEVLFGLATRPGHPCSADRIHRYVRAMPMADRDLTWSEFIRNSGDTSTPVKLIEWVERNADTAFHKDAVDITTTLLALLLTSVHRPFRDRVTRALFLIGLKHPEALFARTLAHLDFNDAYVPERLLAASYGIAMSLWADPAGAAMRAALNGFVRNLVRKMFVPGAPCATRHVLMRDYALNLIKLARVLDATAIPRRQLRYLRPPFAHLPEQIPAPETLTERQREETEPALQMDFDNYTLGSLIPGRQNYDAQNAEYQLARNRLLGRMSQLGYAYTRFRHIDDLIGRYNWNRDNDPNKTDRYGKKYSWIAFFELYGLRKDNGQVDDSDDGRSERISECDIDPSFPEPPGSWAPTLPDTFENAPVTAADWLRSGPVPRYDGLLQRTSVDGCRGPWLLLNGFVEQTATDEVRRVFSFLRGLLIPSERIQALRQILGQTEYPGNHAIPRPYEDHYTFAGEIPWSEHFGYALRTRRGRPRRNVQSAFRRAGRGQRRRGIPIETPVHEFGWESYHSSMNQSGGVEVPAPALCESLRLTNRPRSLDLYDANGRQATLYRRLTASGKGWLLYMRASSLRRYLRHTDQALVWIVWGERNFSAGSGMHQREDLRTIFQGYPHIHKRLIVHE